MCLLKLGFTSLDLFTIISEFLDGKVKFPLGAILSIEKSDDTAEDTKLSTEPEVFLGKISSVVCPIFSKYIL